MSPHFEAAGRGLELVAELSENQDVWRRYEQDGGRPGFLRAQLIVTAHEPRHIDRRDRTDFNSVSGFADEPALGIGGGFGPRC